AAAAVDDLRATGGPAPRAQAASPALAPAARLAHLLHHLPLGARSRPHRRAGAARHPGGAYHRLRRRAAVGRQRDRLLGAALALSALAARLAQGRAPGPPRLPPDRRLGATPLSSETSHR